MIDIVLQGKVDKITPNLVDNLLSTSFVGNIILSTWQGEKYDDPRIKTIFSEDVFPSVGNRNRQIKSSREGLKLVETDVCVKMRTDQLFPINTLEKMNNFYRENSNDFKIFVLGLYRNWPFHPRDHVFWGPSKQVKLLFDIPYDDSEGDIDYTQCLRAEAWFGCHYAARFDSKAQKMMNDYRKYYVDNAPLLEEAFKVHNYLYEKLFQSFPKLDYSWPKHGIEEYYYDYAAQDWSEYWHKELEYDILPSKELI